MKVFSCFAKITPQAGYKIANRLFLPLARGGCYNHIMSKF